MFIWVCYYATYFMVCKLYHLGGQDFDERIMKYVIEEIKKSNNYDISQQPKWMKRLRRACKEAKESLSFQMESYNVNVRNGNFIYSEMELISLQLDINDDTTVNVEISRSNFNQLCEKLFDRAMRMVELALRIAQISAEQIDNVVILLLEKARL